MDHTIVVLDGYTLNPGDLSWEGFSNLGDLTVYDRTPKEEILTRIGDADIVITNKTPLDRHTIGQAKNMKYIGVLATGYNVVDTQAAKQRGIVVCNIPAYGSDAVAQYAFALLLEVTSQVQLHNEAVKQGRWTNSPDFCFWDKPLIELYGKTMGIIGYGRIGQAVGRIAKAFGTQVIAYNRSQDPALKKDYVSLDELFERSDVISLHCPLTEQTKGIINKSSIEKMKDGVIIINNSRGPLVVEQDLADALNSGKVYGAAVDVVSEEPIKAENPLLTAKNCIITPHISWAPRDTRQRLMNIAVENLKAFFAGKTQNVVNP